MTHNKPLLRFRLHDVVVLVSFLSLFALQLQGFSSDPGVGWHLKTGEWVATHRAAPLIDPFLQVESGSSPREWVSDQWLADLVFYSLMRAGGLDLTAAVFCSLFLFAFLGVFREGIRRTSVSALSATCVAFLVLKIGSIHLILRPVVFSFLFLPVAVLSARAIAIGPVPLSWPRVAALAGMFALWANLHPTFILGLIWLGLGAAYRTIGSLGSSHRRSECWKAAATLGACALATGINPYGFELHASINALAGNQFFMNYHREWQSPNFRRLEGQLFQAVVLIIVIGALAPLKEKLSYRPFDVLATLLAGHFALESVRLLPFFGIVAGPLAAQSLDRIARSVAGLFHSESKTGLAVRRIVEREQSSKAWDSFFAIAVLTLGCCCFTAATGRLPIGPTSLEASPKDYPRAALEFARANVQGSHVITAPPEWGGYIIGFGYPRFRAVIDDRNTLLGEAFYRSFFAAAESPEGLARLMRRHESNLLLVPADGKLDCRLADSALFTLVYRAEGAVLFKLEAL
jgi:hypothetical protein